MDLIDKLKKADKLLQGENLHESKPLLIQWFAEIYQEITETPFTYQMGYKLTTMQAHIPTYRKYAMKHREKALAATHLILMDGLPGAMVPLNLMKDTIYPHSNCLPSC
ncbi:hypothetical protein [Lysinibacillus sp. NPDC092081]|uniref:hypothetical protein n=1 Tax=Lysinibacillus sp. NPDC092081 TaxID=3364131 RepID=UPI00380CDC16